MSKYWRDRYKKESEALLNKTIWQEVLQYQKIYLNSVDVLVDKLVAGYMKVLAAGGVDGVTRNTLYQYNRYYKMLKQCEHELNHLNDKLDTSLKTTLEDMYKESSEFVGKMLKEQSIQTAYESLDERAMEAVNSIWCSDGKHWSQRLWGNTKQLETNLMNVMPTAIALGQGAVYVERELIKEFNSSYSAAKRLAVTELSHIYNQAAIDRMKAAGIEEWEWLTAKDETVCKECSKLNGKRFPISAVDKIPPAGSHANCRCTILSVLPSWIQEL